MHSTCSALQVECYPFGYPGRIIKRPLATLTTFFFFFFFFDISTHTRVSAAGPCRVRRVQSAPSQKSLDTEFPELLHQYKKSKISRQSSLLAEKFASNNGDFASCCLSLATPALVHSYQTEYVVADKKFQTSRVPILRIGTFFFFSTSYSVLGFFYL